LSTAVIIAVAIFTSITAPLVLAYLTAVQHRRDREADWARQDRLAARTAATLTETNSKLDTIHVLVNSNMTAAMQSELDAIQRELAMMREVTALNLAAGREPTPESLGAIQATEAKIAELTAELTARRTAATEAGTREAEEQ
jgi:hypothetical protein